jgi:hypothetical protein
MVEGYESERKRERRLRAEAKAKAEVERRNAARRESEARMVQREQVQRVTEKAARLAAHWHQAKRPYDVMVEEPFEELPLKPFLRSIMDGNMGGPLGPYTKRLYHPRREGWMLTGADSRFGLALDRRGNLWRGSQDRSRRAFRAEEVQYPRPPSADRCGSGNVTMKDALAEYEAVIDACARDTS